MAPSTHPIAVLSTVYEDLHVVGDVMVLKQVYDRDQLWLPLGDTILFKAEPSPTPPIPYARHNFKDRTYVAISDQARMMYPRDNSIYAKQYVLPFAEHKRVNNGALKALKKHHFPLWDKRPNANSKQVMDDLFSLNLDRTHERFDIEAWCNENLRGRYYLRSDRVIYFELEFDALMAKMYFS